MEDYSTIRSIVGYLIGKTVVDITQHDEDEYDSESEVGSYVQIMFSDGSWIKFPTAEVAFWHFDVNGTEEDCDEGE